MFSKRLLRIKPYFKLFTRNATARKRNSKCVSPDCKHEEIVKTCNHYVECGPCSKYKYMDVRCKVALITGGSCGIGFSTASELLCQDAYRVVLADHNLDKGLEAAEKLEALYGKNKVCYVQLDENREAAFEAVFRMIHERFGGVDIMVNSGWNINKYKWEHDIDTNLKGIFRGVVLANKWMPKERKSMKGGVIVNIAATSGLETDQQFPLYTGVKHAVVGLSKSFGNAVHFQQTGVRVVCLCPDRTDSTVPQELKGKDPKEQRTYYDTMEKMQSPAKVAKAVPYLVRYAPSGTVWVVENNTLFRAPIPDRKTYSKLVDYL